MHLPSLRASFGCLPLLRSKAANSCTAIALHCCTAVVTRQEQCKMQTEEHWSKMTHLWALSIHHLSSPPSHPPGVRRYSTTATREEETAISFSSDFLCKLFYRLQWEFTFGTGGDVSTFSYPQKLVVGPARGWVHRKPMFDLPRRNIARPWKYCVLGLSVPPPSSSRWFNLTMKQWTSGRSWSTIGIQ